MLRIVVERSGTVLFDEVFRKSLVSIGRDAANDIVLDDSRVSAQHAVIKSDTEARFRIFDQSSNGTFWEGERIGTLRVEGPTLLTIADEFQVTLIPIQKGGTEQARGIDLTAPTVVDDEIPQLDVGVTAPHLRVDQSQPLGDAELRAISRDGELRAIVFSESVMIGRSSECDLQFLSRDISRRHCTISATSHGFVIHRLSAKNGLTVNDRELGQGESLTLKDGDVIRMCEEEVIFLYPATRPHGKVSMNLPQDAAPNLDVAVVRRGCADGTVTAFDLVGFLGAKTCARFEEEMMRQLRTSRRVMIDLGYLVGLDGSGIASLGRIVKEAEAVNVPIQFIRVTPRVADMLTYSPLNPVLNTHICNSEETAIRRLRS
ncbi:MAG: FHA domain-containing protein [Thermoanaerobaculia bacterium]